MNTDQLVRTLVADTDSRERPVGSVLAVALVTGGAVSIVMFFAFADRARCWSRPTAEAEICQTLPMIPRFQGRHETEYPRPSLRN